MTFLKYYELYLTGRRRWKIQLVKCKTSIQLCSGFSKEGIQAQRVEELYCVSTYSKCKLFDMIFQKVILFHNLKICIYSSIISKCQEDTSISIGSMNVSWKSTLLFLFHHYQTNKYKVSIEGKRYKIVCFIGVGITCTFLLHFTLLRSKKEVSFLHDIINFYFFCASFMIKLLYYSLDFLFW